MHTAAMIADQQGGMSEEFLEIMDQERISGGAKSQQALRKLDLVGRGFPRNLPAYKVIQEAFSDFEYHIHEENGKRRVVFGNHPLIKGNYPSLADLVRESLREPGSRRILHFDAFPPDVQRKADLLQHTKHGYDLVTALLDLPAVMPPRKIMHKIGDWLTAAEKGEEVVIFSPVCPDYEVRATGDPRRPWEYTFEGLGQDVGLVAQRIQRAIPQLWKFFKKLGIRVKFVVAMGDIEFNNVDTLKRVGLPHDECIRRVRLSQKAFARGCSDEIDLETPLMSELFAGQWDETVEKAKQAVSRGEFSALNPSAKDLQLMSLARKPLYERWFGEGVDVYNAFLQQIPEYMATGYLVGKVFDHSLILGADAIAMATFLQGLSKECRPVVYLRSASY